MNAHIETPEVEALILSHTALVGHIVRETMSRVPSHVDRDDLTSAGLLALVQAAQAFDAERCVRALDESLGGSRPFDEAMAEYQRERDAHALPMYELTTQLATLEPPSPEMQQLFRALAANPRAADEFAKMNAGTISPAEFFAPEHVRAIVEGTRAAG